MKANVIPICSCNSFYGKLEIGELSVNNNTDLFIPYYCNSCKVIESRKYSAISPICHSCNNKLKRYGFIERNTGDEIYSYSDNFMERFVLYAYIEPNMIYSLSNEKHFCPNCKNRNLTFLT
jgi:ribosomal protein L37AE/L43A